MASYEVGEDGEDSAATAQSRNLLYADDFYSTINYQFAPVLCYEITVCR